MLKIVPTMERDLKIFCRLSGMLDQAEHPSLLVYILVLVNHIICDLILCSAVGLHGFAFLSN